jgi:hypothetical protein
VLASPVTAGNKLLLLLLLEEGRWGRGGQQKKWQQKKKSRQKGWGTLSTTALKIRVSVGALFGRAIKHSQRVPGSPESFGIRYELTTTFY